jgi:hypothetical protein
VRSLPGPRLLQQGRTPRPRTLLLSQPVFSGHSWMGLLHSLPRAEQRQYDAMKPWVKLAFERVDWFYSQGTPADVPEYKEAIDYYAQVAVVARQWRMREREHWDSGHAEGCHMASGQISCGPAVLLSLWRPTYLAELLAACLLCSWLQVRHGTAARAAAACVRAAMAG